MLIFHQNIRGAHKNQVELKPPMLKINITKETKQKTIMNIIKRMKIIQAKSKTEIQISIMKIRIIMIMLSSMKKPKELMNLT